MSPSMCHGLQSRLQPCFFETCNLKLSLYPPEPNLSRSSCWSSSKPSDSDFDTEEKSQIQEKNSSFSKSKNKDVEMGSMSFLQALTSTSDSTQKGKTDTEKVYVHPLSKRSSLVLSAKSLEMCTENLGSETGSDIIESSHNGIPLLFQENEKLLTITKCSNLKGETLAAKRLKHNSSFPPPLTSINSSNTLQVRPHREDGRLVLTAVTACSTYFQAERSDGRLKLNLLNSFSPNYDNGENQEEKEEEEFSGEEDDEVEVEGEGEGEEETEEGKKGEDTEGNSGNEEGEIGSGKKIKKLIFGCKEGGRDNKSLINWEPFWVA